MALKDGDKRNRTAFKEFAESVINAERDMDRIAGMREALKVLDERVAGGGFAEKLPSFAQSFIDTVRTILH